ncbi:low molecular weight protein-tyrosine-phosphatase [Schaalia sp. lx-260]|uniref:low molecular weight protein-tyrosine-phosphatase n=1 Tax=Schaalia sp. lx-260 TaxID=2899082 RepID=UPI001E3C6BA8|nr:low molecular weight protein-tyrosine-phosphatase [Schaalia sp. lx-260]MCD4550046.1 low molecular weight phosphotyrosine protein phosphatase [Schaalia sp. lx-260]
MTVRVLMVCTGNICRSTMAHQVFAEVAAQHGLDVHVDSAGVSDEEHGNPIDRRAARVLREAGYAVPDHRARQIHAHELSQWDVVLAMTDYHLRSLNRLRERAGLPRPSSSDAQSPFVGPDIRMFRDFDPKASASDRDLPDPWYGGHQDFVQTLEVIERSMPNIIEYIRSLGA